MPTPQDPSRPQRRFRRDLGCILGDGVAYSVMVGVGESFLPAFVLALGLGEVLAGLIATVPMMLGGLLQLGSPWGIRWLASRKWWVVSASLIQAACFLPLVWLAVTGTASTWLVLAITTLYWAAGLATSAAWNDWVAVLVPGRVRANYFAYRARWGQIGVLFGFVVAGAALQFGESSGYVLPIFAGMFVVAFAVRVTSAYFLARQSEPRKPSGRPPRTLRVAARHFRSGPTARLLRYLLAVQFSVWIAGPFFTAYMLVQCGFCYGSYMVLLAVAFLSKSIALPLLGKLARRRGVWPIFVQGGIGLCVLPLLWIGATDFWYLLVVQLLGGVFWAAYELGMFLLLLGEIPGDDRTEVLTVYNAANPLAMTAGSLLGAALVAWMPDVLLGYYVTFGLSGAGRVAALGLLAGSGVWKLRPKLRPYLSLRVLAIRPGAASLDRPIVPALQEEPRPEPSATPACSL